MILSRLRLLPQVRYDLEDFIAQQSSVRTDAKFWTKQFLSGENYIVKGFGVSGIGLNQATIEMDNATLIFPQNTNDFSWFTAEETPTDIVIPDADLTDGVKNYVEIYLVTENNTPITKPFWDPAANSGEGAEFTQEVDTMTDLQVAVSVRTGGFSGDPDRLPLAIIETNGSGTIIGIRDKRKLFFRLGAPGSEDQDFTWASRVEPTIALTLSAVTGSFIAGETISFTSGATATVVSGGTTSITIELPDSDSFALGDTATTSSGSGTLDQYLESFTGADKDIDDFRESLEAIMTEIKLLKGTRFWYQNATMSLDGISQQINSMMVQEVAGAKYSWDGSNLSITDDSGTPADADVLAALKLFGESNDLQLTRQDGTGGSAVIPVAEDEIVYIELPSSGNRIYSGVGAAATNFKIAAISSYVKDDNHYWIGYRKLNRIYIRGYGEMEAGETVIISDPQKEDILAQMAANQTMNNQDRVTKLVGGGTWSWDLTAGELVLSASAYLQVAGITKESNEISAQTITLSANDQVAYVSVKRTDGASVLTVSVVDEASVVLDDNVTIIARRINDEILVGKSFLLKDGEFLELDGALAEINRFHGQLKVKPESPVSTKVTISGSDIARLSGESLTLEQKNLLLAFDGAVIDFSTGEVFESDGVTPLLAGANDFTPATITASEYFFYSVSILPNVANANNTISGQVLVLPATGSDAVLADAPRAPFPGSGIKLANVMVQDNGTGGAGTINNIDYANLYSLGVGGSGGGGTGDATSDETSYRDRLLAAPYDYANMNIAAVEEDGQLDGASTATFDIPSGNFKFLDSTAQDLISTQQADDDFLAEEIDISTIELFGIWDLDAIDTGATYQVSRDGGNEYQTVTMSRIGNSDSYRGTHTFTDEASNAFNQEYAVANADSIKDFNSSTQQEISQKFTVANTTVYKNIIAYINKNSAGAAGNLFVEIVRDDTGAPSTDVNDIVWTSAGQDITALATGNNVVNIDAQIVMVAGDYHMIIRTDQAYKDAYDLSATDKISARMDSSAGPTPNLRTYNGTVWSSEVANETMVYRLEGRELDLRVKITSAATANDKLLSSYCIFYKYENGVQFTNPVFRELFQFDGTVDNDNEFTLTNFLPDSRLLMCFAGETGQVFRYGDFTIQGSKVIFPVNTFNVVGTVKLEFFQVGAIDGVISNVADALITANHLGSTDATIDKSVAGHGIYLRRPDGTLREIAIDDNDNIVIYSI